MNTQTLRLFFGSLAGFGALLWFLRRRRFAARTADVHIILKGTKGGCGVQSLTPDSIELSKRSGDIARWHVTNPSRGGCAEVTVKIGDWELNGHPVEPPVHGPLSARVRPGHRQPIPGNVKLTAENGDYRYHVLINGVRAHDPLVRVVD